MAILTSALRALQEFIREVLEVYREEIRVSDLDKAAYVLVSCSEGLGSRADARFFSEGLVDEMTDLFSRYLLEEPDNVA
mgnify:CR=1 FL=1